MEGSAVEAGEPGAETELVAMIDLEGREAEAATDLVALTLDLILAPAPEEGQAGAVINLVALALDLILILALAPEDGEAGAATNLCALALYLRGVTALNVTPH